MQNVQVEVKSMVEEECVQILMSLELTLLQTKVYLALSRTGKAKIETISKASNVVRQDVYRIMPALQKMGLAEKIVAAPIMYNPAPLKEGLSILLRHRAEEYVDLQKKAISLLNSFQDNNGITMLQEEPQLTISSGKMNTLKACIKEINAA